MISPASGAPAPKSGPEIPVPVASLAIDAAEPAAGDEVEFSVKATVARVENGQAYVTPTEVNGQPFAAPSEPAPAAEPTDEDMMRAAEDADRKAL